MSQHLDWESRYQQHDTPWAHGEAAPPLVHFLRSTTIPLGPQVLLPGCGKGHDAIALARAGFNVTGIDLAPSAVNAAAHHFAHHNLQGDFHCQDFFQHRFDERLLLRNPARKPGTLCASCSPRNPGRRPPRRRVLHRYRKRRRATFCHPPLQATGPL